MRTDVLRGLPAALLTVLSLTTATPVHAAETVPLAEAVASLPLATESRDGYTRDAFKHWNSGDGPADGCSTRNEVLIHEAVEAPAVGPRCRLTGGSWWSYYDQTTLIVGSHGTGAAFGATDEGGGDDISITVGLDLYDRLGPDITEMDLHRAIVDAIPGCRPLPQDPTTAGNTR
ncbi:hypothetical protein [Streptomyces canus]|uniref:hypothetical protein n=1 Tax=Streptomyces canus TaxID=58343 RepID=UPI003803C9C1